MAFQMSTAARANSVVRALKGLSEEFGNPLNLSKSRKAVAGMYGYPNWNALLDSLGSEQSPDDGEVSEQERAERQKAHVSALVDAGFKPEDAETIAARLSPSERSDPSNWKGPTIDVIQTQEYYHPSRFMLLTQTLRDDYFADHDADEMHDAIRDTLNNFETHRNNHYFDAERPFADRFGMLYAVVNSAMWSVTVDASAIVSEMASTPHDTRWLPKNRDATIYFHLGYHALPSRFPGLGVEGFYLHMDGRDAGRKDIHLLFVVSQPEEGNWTPGIGVNGALLPALRNNTRYLHFAMDMGRDRDTSSFSWSMPRHLIYPLPQQLLQVAFNTIRRYETTDTLDMPLGFTQWDDKLPEAYRLARSEKRRLAIIRQARDEYPCHPPVRFLGRDLPPNDRRSWDWGRDRKPAFDTQEIDYDYCQSLLSDAAHKSYIEGTDTDPETMTAIADEIIEIIHAARPRLQSGPLDPRRTEEEKIYARALSARANGLLEKALRYGPDGEAERQAFVAVRALVERVNSDPGELLVSILPHLIEHPNFKDVVDAAVAKWAGDSHPHVFVACMCKALHAAWAGNHQRAVELLIEAEDIYPGTVSGLMVGRHVSGDEHVRWIWIRDHHYQRGRDWEVDAIEDGHHGFWGWAEQNHGVLTAAKSALEGPEAGPVLH